MICGAEGQTASTTGTAGIGGILHAIRGGKVQVVGVPSGRSTQLLLPTDGRAREHLTVRFVGDPAEVTFRVLELTALVRPIREEFAIWRDSTIGLTMLPVAHDDPLAVHVGIVIASLDHTIILLVHFEGLVFQHIIRRIRRCILRQTIVGRFSHHGSSPKCCKAEHGTKNGENLDAETPTPGEQSP